MVSTSECYHFDKYTSDVLSSFPTFLHVGQIQKKLATMLYMERNILSKIKEVDLTLR